MHIAISNRERASYIMLRRKGYSITTLARAFGRSVSSIYGPIKKAMEYGTLQWFSKRKQPNAIRKIIANNEWFRLQKYIGMWEAWILSDQVKPP